MAIKGHDITTLDELRQLWRVIKDYKTLFYTAEVDFKQQILKKNVLFLA